GPQSARTAPVIVAVALVLQVELTLAQGLAVVGIILTSGGGEVNGVHIGPDGLEDQLGNDLAGSGLGQVDGAIQVLQHIQLSSGGGHLDGPAEAGELVVLVIAHSTQDHGKNLVAGDVIGRAEGVVLVALDILGIGAVVDVASEP